MEDFEFYTPTKVIFGKNAELQIGREIASDIKRYWCISAELIYVRRER